jgi:hypothetical protein
MRKIGHHPRRSRGVHYAGFRLPSKCRHGDT